MNALATLDDVEASLGYQLDDMQRGQVGRWLAVVEARIRQRLPLIDQWIAAGKLNAVVVSQVVVDVVTRRLMNPEGKRTERIDDYSYTLSAESSDSSLRLTEHEWEQLNPLPASGAFSVRPTGHGPRSARWYCQ